MHCIDRRNGVRVGFGLAMLAMASILSSVAHAETIDSRYGGKLSIEPNKFRIYDLPNNQFESLTGLPLSIQSPEPSVAEKRAEGAMATGRVLTILIEWPNRFAEPSSHPPEAYDSMLYSDDVYPTGSAKDYYQEVSYGDFGITGEVIGWLMMPSNYNVGYNISQIVAAADPLVDFSDYDGDNNGKVDALWIVYAGTGENETHDPWDIWPHAVIGANVATSDGVTLDRWSVQPEQYANGNIMAIRVFCHEYGHILGLPDLYDYDDKLDTVAYFTPNDWNDHPVNDWDVMGYGGYAIMNFSTRQCPSHFCAWSRAALGWVTPVVPPCLSGTYQLYNIEVNSSQNVFKIPISADGQEYFLLEYRNPRSSAQFDHVDGDFSAYCPWFTPGSDTLDQGLLITHIDDAMGYGNNGTPSRPHYAVEVMDAGYDPAHPWNGNEFTEWWHPYEFQVGALFSPDDPGQTQFTPTSTPNSDGYSGPTGLSITVTGQNANYLTLTINKPVVPVIDPIAPITVEVGESIAVGIVANDANCTAPSLLSSGLPVYATVVDSGGGRGSLTLEPEESDLGTIFVLLRASDGALEDSLQVQVNVVPPACDCPCDADPECDGVTTVLDVTRVINVAFRGVAAVLDPDCPRVRTDVDADGVTNVLDVTKTINVAFRGQSSATNFVNPCL